MPYKTREKLVEVARQLFVHKGLENTTMNDIANASEKGRRTIYTYFRNKKEIYNAVLEHESDRMVSAMKEIADSPYTADNKLRRFLTVRIEQVASINSSYSALKSLFKFDLRRMARIRRVVLEKESLLLHDILSEGIADGIFDEARATKAERFMLSCITGMNLAETDAENADDLSAIQAEFIDFVVTDLTFRPQQRNNPTL